MPLTKSVDEMLSDLPAIELAIARRLRELVLACLPFVTEKPYYGMGIPYYSRYRQICYILPASALCHAEEEQVRSAGVTLGFCQGNLMANENGVLKAEGRKQVRVLHFQTLREIKEDEVRALLFEAGLIDDSFRKGMKTPKSKSR